MNLKNTKKNQKGITLIALVITIIVLLILTGVTISAVRRDNSTIAQAKEAKKEYQEATDIEVITLAVAGKKLGEVTNGETITAENLKAELKKTYDTIEIDVTGLEGKEGEFRVLIDENEDRQYTVYNDGTVTKRRIITFTYNEVTTSYDKVGTTYEAFEGMTWKELCNSEKFNSEKIWVISGGMVLYTGDNSWYGWEVEVDGEVRYRAPVCRTSWLAADDGYAYVYAVSPDEPIIEGHNYSTDYE